MPPPRRLGPARPGEPESVAREMCTVRVIYMHVKYSGRPAADPKFISGDEVSTGVAAASVPGAAATGLSTVLSPPPASTFTCQAVRPVQPGSTVPLGPGLLVPGSVSPGRARAAVTVPESSAGVGCGHGGGRDTGVWTRNLNLTRDSEIRVT